MEQIFGGGRGGSQFEGFGDFFEQMVGGQGAQAGAGAPRGTQRRPQAAPTRGANVRHELEIPLEVAVRGGTTEFYLHDGTHHEKIAVNIPPGVEKGSKIRLRNRGQASPSGGPNGDLILLIKVSDHPHYHRSGRNLQLDLPVSIIEAIGGSKVDVTTPDGTVALTIPPGTSSGKRLRLKGQGVKQRDGSVGDLIVVVQIHVPESVDDETKSMLEKLEETYPLHLRENITF